MVTVSLASISVGGLYVSVADTSEDLAAFIVAAGARNAQQDSDRMADVVDQSKRDRRQWDQIRSIQETLIRIDERTKQTSEDITEIKQEMKK